MARPKLKEYKPLTVRMDAAIYDRLDDYAQESGQTKTVAIERALTMYMDNYEKKMAILDAIEKNDSKKESILNQ